MRVVVSNSRVCTYYSLLYSTCCLDPSTRSATLGTSLLMDGSVVTDNGSDLCVMTIRGTTKRKPSAPSHTTKLAIGDSVELIGTRSSVARRHFIDAVGHAWHKIQQTYR